MGIVNTVCVFLSSFIKYNSQRSAIVNTRCGFHKLGTDMSVYSLILNGRYGDIVFLFVDAFCSIRVILVLNELYCEMLLSVGVQGTNISEAVHPIKFPTSFLKRVSTIQ